jgi:hypothetical protein
MPILGEISPKLAVFKKFHRDTWHTFAAKYALQTEGYFYRHATNPQLPETANRYVCEVAVGICNGSWNEPCKRVNRRLGRDVD